MSHLPNPIYCFLLMIIGILIGEAKSGNSFSNPSPVIGILAQDSVDPYAPTKYGSSYIDATYVKYVEEGGAMVLPIRLNKSIEYYADVFNKTNGLLIPGGGANLLTSYYAKAAQILFGFAKKANDNGDHYPIWGTCNGFELLTALVARKDLLVSCKSEDLMLPLKLLPGVQSSKLFTGIPTQIIRIVSTENVTANYHKFCFTEEVLNGNQELVDFFQPLTTSFNGQIEFISTMEAKRYPFYGTQWHPEKHSFDWNINDHLPRTYDAILMQQYFSAFLIKEARKSRHHFPDMKSQSQAVIQNFNPIYLKYPTLHLFYFFD